MGSRDYIYDLSSFRIAVGPSNIIGLTAIAGLNATAIKWSSGGSLEIVSGTSSGATTGGWGTGWLFGTGEIFNWNSSGTIYLAATGSTAIAMVVRGRSG